MFSEQWTVNSESYLCAMFANICNLPAGKRETVVCRGSMWASTPTARGEREGTGRFSASAMSTVTASHGMNGRSCPPLHFHIYQQFCDNPARRKRRQSARTKMRAENEKRRRTASLLYSMAHIVIVRLQDDDECSSSDNSGSSQNSSGNEHWFFSFRKICFFD